MSNSSQGFILATNDFNGIRLDRLTTMNFSTYAQGVSTTNDLSLQFDVKYRPGDIFYGGRLVFEPYFNGTVVPERGSRGRR